jgi:hypothetical protein
VFCFWRAPPHRAEHAITVPFLICIYRCQHHLSCCCAIYELLGQEGRLGAIEELLLCEVLATDGVAPLQDVVPHFLPPACPLQILHKQSAPALKPGAARRHFLDAAANHRARSSVWHANTEADHKYHAGRPDEP